MWCGILFSEHVQQRHSNVVHASVAHVNLSWPHLEAAKTPTPNTVVANGKSSNFCRRRFYWLATLALVALGKKVSCFHQSVRRMPSPAEIDSYPKDSRQITHLGVEQRKHAFSGKEHLQRLIPLASGERSR